MENIEPEFLHDVYLTFRGHARHGIFTGNLKCALSQKRFRTFMNDEATLSGDQISPALFEAIEQSRMSIVVFSPKHPDSNWYFEELVKIVECSRTKNQIVWPIFYKVLPSTVRNFEKWYGDAMAKHKKKFEKEPDKVKKWKQALSEIAKLETGIKPFKDGYEYEYIQKIVEKVAQSLPRYNIFLSFRGKDTRYSFTGFLIQALQREGFNTVMDQVLEGGDHIPLFLINAIKTSRLSIVVLSENYAYSSWCLDELVNILECAKTNNQLVWPIFYKVKPSDVRYQRNSYDEAMTALEEKFVKDPEKVSKWRSALTEVGNIKGWELEAKQYEYDLIEKVVEKAIASDNFLCMPSPCSSPCPSPSSSPCPSPSSTVE